jgi:hypothetical protein
VKILPKAGAHLFRPLLARLFLARPFLTRSVGIQAALVVALAAGLGGLLYAQASKTITVIMLDGKTGKAIIPSNFVIRVDHRDAIHNEWLRLNDDGAGFVSVPAETTFVSVQGTYNGSTDIYINCDAGMEKDTTTLHWYSVPDILSTGVNAPNECYKGKYADATHLDPKAGIFVFYVREIGWHDARIN